MNKFMQSNQMKRHIIQKLHSFLCSLTYYKSVTKILQNGYKWLQICNHINFTKVAGAVSIVYTGCAGIYTRKGAANELRLGAAFGATFGSYIERNILNTNTTTTL